MTHEPPVSLTIRTDDQTAVAETMTELGLTPVAGTAPTERRGIEALGPVTQYVLPSIGSFALAARTVIALTRKFRTGTIIDSRPDGALIVDRDKDLPRGMIVVRKDGNTIDILDVTEDGKLERLTDLLRRPPG